MGVGVGGGNLYFGVLWKLVAATAVFASIALAPAVSVADGLEPFDVANHPFWTVDEVRLGGYKQAIDNAPHEGGPALNLEVLGGRFPGGYENSILDFFLTPRPQLGTTIAFGKTDEFYWGVAWDAKLIDRTFFEASFGGAAHDGPLNAWREASYGCEVNFKEFRLSRLRADGGLAADGDDRPYVERRRVPAEPRPHQCGHPARLQILTVLCL